MRLTDWAKKRGHGAYTELFRKSGVSFKTVLKAAARGEPVVFEVAEKLSAVTGGECSIDEIRFPDGRPADSVPPVAP